MVQPGESDSILELQVVWASSQRGFDNSNLIRCGGPVTEREHDVAILLPVRLHDQREREMNQVDLGQQSLFVKAPIDNAGHGAGA